MVKIMLPRLNSKTVRKRNVIGSWLQKILVGPCVKN